MGFVDGPKGHLHLTDAGWSRFGIRDAAGAGDALDAAASVWPYAHRAFLELLASAVIGRHHLGAARPEAHLVFVAIGESRTGKSALGAQLCHLFGFDVEGHTRDLQILTSGEILGRRWQTADGWTFDEAPTLRLPFVLLDEADKAEGEVRRAVQPLMQAKYALHIEGANRLVHPTPMLVANPPAKGDRLGQVHSAYLRRAVVLDTGYAVDQLSKLGRQLRGYLEAHRPGPLRLETLTPPAATLPASAMALIDAMTAHVLTDAGRASCPDERAFEIAALGRAALLGLEGEEGLQLATYYTLVSYLQTTETVLGQVVEGWPAEAQALRDHFGAAAEELVAVLERGKRGRHEVLRRAQRVRAIHDVEDLELVERRHALAERLRQAAAAIERVPADRRPAAVGLRASLRKLRDRALDVRSMTALEDLGELARDPYERAVAMRAGIDRDRAAQEREAESARAEQRWTAQQEREAAKLSARHAKEQATAARSQARSTLESVVSQAKELEGLWRRGRTHAGELPWTVLRDLRVAGYSLLTWEPPMTEEVPKGLRRLGYRRPEGVWVVAGSGQRFGTWNLREWGPTTQAVLAPTLAHLHQVEDQLREQLHRAPRQSRPHVDPAGAASRAVAAVMPAPRALEQRRAWNAEPSTIA
ncbi:MAG: hypothetical protein ACJ71Y_01185 [Blastococcus sp.]